MRPTDTGARRLSAARVWILAPRREVGYLPQHYNLFPHLNLAKNITYGLESGRGNEANRRTDELLDASKGNLGACSRDPLKKSLTVFLSVDYS